MSERPKEMTQSQAYNGFKIHEAVIERDHKAGRLSREQASRLLRRSRENYRSGNYNKQIKRMGQ